MYLPFKVDESHLIASQFYARMLQCLYRGVEQLVARKAHNLEVGGSSPPPATKT